MGRDGGSGIIGGKALEKKGFELMNNAVLRLLTHVALRQSHSILWYSSFATQAIIHSTNLPQF